MMLISQYLNMIIYKYIEMKKKNVSIKALFSILLIFCFISFIFQNKINNNEHFIGLNKKASNFDVSTGSTTKYGWGAPIEKTERVEKPPRRPPRRLPRRPPINGEIQDKYIINDFRGSCENCDIVKHSDINRYVLKSSIPPGPDLNKYILKTKIPVRPDMSRYILKSKIPVCPNMSKYILKSKIPPCPNVFKHLDNASGGVYSCNLKTPLLPQRCPKVKDSTKIVRIKEHPDFHKYELKNEFKKTKELGLCHNGNLEYGKKLPGMKNETEYSKY
jgi:hypothetical protein